MKKETMADIRRKITKSVTEKTQKTYEKNFNTWRDYDLLTCLIAIVGLLLAIVEYEYTFRQVNQAYSSDKLEPYVDKAYNEVQLRLQLSEASFVRVVIALTSLFGIVTLFYRHYTKSKWLNEDLPS